MSFFLRRQQPCTLYRKNKPVLSLMSRAAHGIVNRNGSLLIMIHPMMGMFVMFQATFSGADADFMIGSMIIHFTEDHSVLLVEM